LRVLLQRTRAPVLLGGGLYRQAFALLASAALFGLPAYAKEGDTFRPFVSYTHYYDSNLYRLADSEKALVPQSSDQYGVLSAGLNVDWQPGRQHVIASASKNLVRYSRYSNLDYDGSDYQLNWNWRLGNHWSGQIGATESATQSSLSDQLGLPINNQVTRENQFANAEWQFHPRWNVGVGAAAAASTNSTVGLAPSDYEDTSVSATLGYTTPKGSKLRGQLRQVDGEYPNRPVTYVDRLYTQTEYNLLGDWNLTGKLTARGKIGYTQRENDTQSQRDFSGVTGRVSADYVPTGKTMLTWALYREISNSDDLNATYQLQSGTSLGAAWLVTSKITLRANAAFDNRSFEGDTGLVIPGLVQRDEDTLSGSLSLSYAPVRMAAIDVGLQAGRRDSNVSANDYTFHSVFVSVRADF
jgi:exopolysaccharide biosynthesis operon protein EpsL